MTSKGAPSTMADGFTPPSEPVNVTPHMAKKKKKTLQMGLAQDLEVGVILGYLGGPEAIIWILGSEKLLLAEVRRRCDYRRKIRETSCFWLWAWKKGGCGQGTWTV